MSRQWTLAALVFLIPTGVLAAPPKGQPREMAGLTAAIFSDHMVLQRDLEVPVWGTTQPGGTVTVTFMKQTKTAKADAAGRWMVKLDKMPAVSQPQEMTVKDATETRAFKDVLVGEVWLCSGQSNMEWGSDWSDAVKKRKYGMKEGDPPTAVMGGKVDAKTKAVLRRAIGNDKIRVSSKTRDHLITKNFGWELVDEKNVITLAALAGCVAVHLQEALDVPVGIIVRSESGTALIEWIDLESFKADPLVKASIERQIEKTGKGGGPTETPGAKWQHYVAATVPYGIRGVLWDQGEWGVGFKGVGWPPAMHALITTWRKTWGQGDFPWSATDRYGKENNLAQALAGHGIAGFTVTKNPPVTAGGLHPVNKEDFAQRHIDNILPQVYGRPAPQWGRK